MRFSPHCLRLSGTVGGPDRPASVRPAAEERKAYLPEAGKWRVRKAAANAIAQRFLLPATPRI